MHPACRGDIIYYAKAVLKVPQMLKSDLKHKAVVVGGLGLDVAAGVHRASVQATKERSTYLVCNVSSIRHRSKAHTSLVE